MNSLTFLPGSSELLARLVDGSGTGVLAVDERGRIIHLNRRGAELTRVDPDAVLGRHLTEVTETSSGPFLPPLCTALHDALLARKDLRRQVVEIDAQGHERSYGYTASCVLDTRPDDESGPPNGPAAQPKRLGAVLTFTDLTEIRRRERFLTEQEYSASLGRVASWIAHEVKNPLATIKMYANLLERAPAEELPQMVGVIRDQVEAAQARISDILRMVSFSPDDRASMAVSSFDQLLSQYVQKEGLPHVAIDLSVEPGSYLVPLSQQEATALVANLVTNAAEALEGPGVVRLLLRRQGDHLIFTVEDTGPGFPDHDLHRLFQPFFTSKPRGTGLGLWTVRRIVDGHRGTVLLSNTDLGGARVEIRLPVLDPSCLQGKRILIVDDEETLRRLLVRQLSAAGALPESVGSGNEALERLTHDSYDLLVTDIYLPGLDGPGLVQRLDSNIPVLLISGATGFETEYPELQRKGLAFLAKPFDSDELTLALSYLLWEVST